MVRRQSVEVSRYDPEEIPEENVERQSEEELSVFEWYCPDCEDWLGWPEQSGHTATVCDDPDVCSHTGENADACGHVVCGDCRTRADSHEWVLEGEQAGWVAGQILDDGPDIETAFKRALIEDLQQVADGESVEEVIADRRELFDQYLERVEDTEQS